MFYPPVLRSLLRLPRLLTCLLLAFAAAVLSQAVVSAQVKVVTQHNDNARTGANLAETTLNTGNVNVTQFGKLFSRAVTGYIYAQPLYLPGLSIGGATHNVVYVGTLNNDVYAFDADDPSQTAPLWHVNLGPARTVNLAGRDFPSLQSGVLSTPVIDAATNTLYVVSNTSVGNCTFHLHALDAATGAEKFGGPSTIAPTYPGTGSTSANGVVSMNKPTHIQRTGLLLNAGRVYIAFASTQDLSPYHGWIVAYSAADLTQPPLVYNDTPNGDEGGIWQGANGLTADAAGNVYAVSGNGTFDTNGGPNHGNSMIKLDSALHVLDWFTPHDSAAMNAGDLDLGSSGLMGIPGTNFFIGGGKTSVLYLVDAANMGKYNASTDGVIQKVPLNAYHLHGGPIYWNSPAHGPTIYTWAEQDYLKGFSFANGLVVPTPITQSSFKAPVAPGDVYGAMPGGILSLSANGSQAGTGIVWACIPATNGHGALPGILRAFDADNLTHELWDSGQNAARDGYGLFGKFIPPTVANGKVYVPTSSGQLAVYGLLPTAPPPVGGGTLSGAVAVTGPTVNLTAGGASDWAHWGLNGANSYIHKATGGGQISDKATTGSGATSYANDPVAYSWSDGTPTATATNTATGVYIRGVGNGFSFTAPADPTLRTLTVYVEAYQAQGLLTASLSDGSAAAISDSSLSVPGNTTVGAARMYTLTYSAASAGQKLTVSWTLATDNGAGGGNVAIQSATLAGGAAPVPPPSAPTNLTATAGNAAVSLAWNTVTGATSYSVYRGTASGGETLLKAGVTAAAYSDAGLTNGTTYFYQVTATGAGGEGARSAEASATPAAPPPGGGTLSGAVAASASVNLTTEGTSDWAHWGLYGPGSFDHKATGGGQISNQTRVGGGGPNAYGDNPSRYTWSDGTPTAAVTSTGTGIYVGGTGNGFSFTVPADPALRTLRVYVGVWRARGQLTATLSDGSAASFVDSSLGDTAGPGGGVPVVYTLTYSAASAGQKLTVSWTVKTDSGGNVNFQAATLAGGAPPPSPPAAPTGLTATPGNATVGLSWNAVSGATSYSLYRGTASGAETLLRTGLTTATYSDTGLTNGTTYFYQVTAVGPGGESARSAEAKATPVAPPPSAPPAPTGLTATAGNAAVSLAWNTVTGATSYSVYRGTASGGETLLKAGVTAAAYSDAGLTNGTTYFYQVTATGAGGEGARSAEASAAPAAPPVGAGSLTGSTAAPPAAVSLSGEGTLDWAHWGFNSVGAFDHKATGGTQISPWTLLGHNGPNSFTNNPTRYSWTDGTPTAAASNTGSGVWVGGTGNGFSFTVPADPALRTLRVYVGVWRARGQLTATLSDGSAASFVDSSLGDTAGPGGGVPVVYTLTYSAASAGQKLTVSWTVKTDSGGNVNFQAATLTGGS